MRCDDVIDGRHGCGNLSQRLRAPDAIDVDYAIGFDVRVLRIIAAQCVCVSEVDIENAASLARYDGAIKSTNLHALLQRGLNAIQQQFSSVQVAAGTRRDDGTI